MKKLTSFLIKAASLFLITLAFSCSYSVSEQGLDSPSPAPSSSFCTFYITLSQDSSRTIFPSAFAKENLYYKFSYIDPESKLTDFPADGSGVTYSVLVAKSFTLILGEYLFSLDAYSDSACTVKVLECTKSLILTESTSSLEMNLKITSNTSQKGSASVILRFPSSLLMTNVTARLAKVSDPEGSVDSKTLTISTAGSEKSVTYSKADLEAGNYIIYFTLSGAGIEETVIPELLIVVAGKESSNASSPITLSEASLKTNIIYVSSSGSDSSGRGSKASPLASLSKAIEIINAKGQADCDWAICLSGSISCGSTPVLPSNLAAKSLTIFGSTGSGTDILMGNGSYTALSLENTIPVRLEKLCVANGGYGGIYIKGSGKVTVADSAVKGCSQGGIRFMSDSSSDLEIRNSVIGGTSASDKNTGSDGGGISKDGSGSLTITGSTISGNVASSSGGGIFVKNGSLILGEGVVISDNSADYGGGLCVSTGASGSYEINGSEISGNMANTNGGGVYVGGGTCTVKGVSKITGNTATGEGGGVYNKGNLFMYGNALIGDRDKSVAATSLSHSNKALTGGGIWTDGKVYLGYSDASTKSELTGGVCYNYSTVEGEIGGICQKGGELFMDSGSVSYNGGGGIYLYNSKCTMSGGAIRGNETSNRGGGLYAGWKGVFTMTGGSISENVSATNGGGVAVGNTGSSFTMSGGTIRLNKAECGGGVYLSGNSFTMTGGEISSNTATDKGNALYICMDGTFTKSGEADLDDSEVFRAE